MISNVGDWWRRSAQAEMLRRGGGFGGGIGRRAAAWRVDLGNGVVDGR